MSEMSCMAEETFDVMIHAHVPELQRWTNNVSIELVLLRVTERERETAGESHDLLYAQ